MLSGAKKCTQKQATKAFAAKQVCSSRASYRSRACIFPGNLPSAPALGQQTSQQHQKGADTSKSLHMVKLRSQADNCAAGMGNLHRRRSRGAGRNLVASGQGKQELPETHLKVEAAEQPSWKGGLKSNIPSLRE